MAVKQTNLILRQVRQLALAQSDDLLSDRELLHRFATQRDEAAFAALVRRHGPLVLGVCRQVLHHEQDAEDCFQATFLLLARDAASPRWQPCVAKWLYRVAYRFALKVRSADQRRRAREGRATVAPVADPAAEVSLRDAEAALHEEVARLPERLRLPVVLADLEGRDRRESARQFGYSETTLDRRLEEARKLIRLRLARRGIALSTALLLTGLAGGLRATERAALLVGPTARAALRLLADQCSLAGRGKLLAVVLGAVLCLVGCGVLACRALLAKGDASPRLAAGPSQRAVKPLGPAEAPLDRLGDPLPAGVLARLGTTRLFHPGGGIQCLAFSPDGRTVVMGGLAEKGQGGVVCLWQSAAGKEVRILAGHTGWVLAVAFSPDGKTVLSAGCGALGVADGTVRLWDAATGKAVRTIRADSTGVCSAAFSPDGRTVASAGRERMIRLHDVVTGKEVRALKGHEGYVRCLAFSGDGKKIASAGEDGSVRVWETASGKEIDTLRGHQGGVFAVAFRPDNRSVLTAAHDSTVRLWDTGTGKEPRVVVRGDKKRFRAAFSRDGRTAATVEANGSVQLWDVATGKPIRTLSPPNQSFIPALAFAPDGKTLAVGADCRAVRLWQVATGKEVHRLPGHKGRVRAVAFLPDGKTMATAASDDSTVRLWQAPTGKPLRTLREHEGELFAVAFSSTGKMVASGKRDGTVRLWQTVSGKVLHELRGHEGPVSAVAFSSDEKVIATGGCDGTVRLWQVGAGKHLRTLRGDQRPVYSLAFAPDGKMLAAGGKTGDEGTACLWDLSTGKPHRRLLGHNGPVSAVAFAPDGRTLATGGWDGVLQLWQTATGKPTRTLLTSPESSVRVVAFSHDGRTLAAARSDGQNVRLWDLVSGDSLPPLVGHRDEVLGVAFSSDGRALASVGSDGTGLVWDLTSSRTRAGGWAELGSKDAARARRAVWALAATPNKSVPLLRERLRPVPAAASRRVARLIADLDDEQFDVRQKATRELEKQSAEVEPALLQALEEGPTLEQRKRLERLLEPLQARQTRMPGELLRCLRAVEVLERCRTPEARAVLERLAGGGRGYRLTEAARAALGRR
jgi:RNA polymerase sigma factor (sigma-70 family)